MALVLSDATRQDSKRCCYQAFELTKMAEQTKQKEQKRCGWNIQTVESMKEDETKSSKLMKGSDKPNFC